VPAAAVIPAPIAYTKVVAVKKLVVEFLTLRRDRPRVGLCLRIEVILEECVSVIQLMGTSTSSFTVSKIECSKQAYAIEYISME
jgi:hypothetical protein